MGWHEKHLSFMNYIESDGFVEGIRLFFWKMNGSIVVALCVWVLLAILWREMSCRCGRHFWGKKKEC